MRTFFTACSLGLIGLVAGGCESAIVGSECRAPLVQCGRYCVDLESDAFNCGACGNRCLALCVQSQCAAADGGNFFPDAGPDAGRDGGHDAGRDGGSDVGTDAFSIDAGSDANVDGGGIQCGLGTRYCGGSCVDTRDGNACGDCATMCGAAEVCGIDGRCAADCGALTACGTRCVDVAHDPHHCGDCATDCGSDLCVASVCTPAGTGHLVIIGHDYETRRIQMSTILANAVFLAPRFPVRVLAFEGDAPANVIAGANAAMVDGANTRTYAVTRTSDVDAVPVMLESADTFLIYAQTNASDASLASTGYAWGRALSEFLDRGGVVVLLDAPSLSNGGTFQIVRTAGLFSATAVSELVTPSLAAAAGHTADPILMNVTFPYSGERHTVRYTTLDPNAIVATGSSPVVFHRSF